MDHATARIMGGLYLALCEGLSDEGVALANDCLYQLADNSPPEDARILRTIANASVNGAPYDQQPESRRSSLKVIEGGAA
jgi:hypothetical protein